MRRRVNGHGSVQYRMRQLKRWLCGFGALCLMFSAMIPAQAAQSEKRYTYKVRIFAGRQGTISGGEELVYDSINYGEQIRFNQSQVQLFDNSKYYIKGIKKSGEDNSEAKQIPAFTVTEDQDYVVAYGILGDAVSYVINYQDQDGNTLAPSETYYGNVGDKPVIAYLYIEGYRPQAYNLTRTLSENAAENVFTFVYYPLEAGGEPAPGGNPGGGTGVNPGESSAAGGTGTIVTPPAAGDAAAGGTGGDQVAPAGPGGGDAPGPGGVDAPGPGGDDDPAPGPGDDDTVNIPDEDVPLTPEDLVDLDPDEEVPLALPDIFRLDSDARILGVPTAAVLGALLALIGGSIWFILMKRKKQKEREKA